MKLLTFWAFLTFLPSIAACGQPSQKFDELLKGMYKNTVPLVKPDQLNKELEAGKSIVLIDAREQKEFEVSHLKGAMYGGYDEFDINNFQSLPKNSKVIVYCSVGYRSERIGEKLIEAGFKDVSNLYGGIFEWKNEGFPVYRNDTETEEVHAYSEKWGKWLIHGKKVYE